MKYSEYVLRSTMTFCLYQFGNVPCSLTHSSNMLTLTCLLLDFRKAPVLGVVLCINNKHQHQCLHQVIDQNVFF